MTRKIKDLKLPFGLGRVLANKDGILLTRDNGSAVLRGGLAFDTEWTGEIIRADGTHEYQHYGSGLVTTAGVNLLAADWTNATATLKLAQYIGTGSSATAATIADTALTTPNGTTATSGTQSNPVAGTYQVVATINFTGATTVNEIGVFTGATMSTATLWDHKILGPNTFANGDQYVLTYKLAIAAGG